MAEFKRVLEGLGFSEVRTLLNSGNAVFAAPGRPGVRRAAKQAGTKQAGTKHAAAIASALRASCDLDIPVIVKSAAELSEVVADCPMAPPEAEHSRFLVALAQTAEALRALEPLRELATGQDRLTITDAAAYLHCPAGVLESKIGAALLGKAGRQVTTRNWGTILKLASLLQPE